MYQHLIFLVLKVIMTSTFWFPQEKKNMVADVFGTLMTDQPDGDLFKARDTSPSDVYELLMTDEHHHDWPLVHHQSVRLQKCCMKPVQSLFSLVLEPSQLTACGFTAQSITHNYSNIPLAFRFSSKRETATSLSLDPFTPTKPEHPSSLPHLEYCTPKTNSKGACESFHRKTWEGVQRIIVSHLNTRFNTAVVWIQKRHKPSVAWVSNQKIDMASSCLVYTNWNKGLPWNIILNFQKWF